MKSHKVLIDKGYNPIYWSNFCIGDNLLGCCSNEKGERNLYKAACIMIEDNDISEEDLNAMIISKEEFKEIALSCDEFYTNFGVDIHSKTLKETKPFNTCKLIKV